jgi:Predicted membrane protein
MYIDLQIYILGALLIVVLAMPVFIYLYYFREPKIDYNVRYETDLPTDDPPAIVNAVCAGDPEKMGIPNLNGFRATILDLIDRNYLLLKNRPENNYSKCLLLEINPNSDISTLWKFEIQVLDFLRRHEEDGLISMDIISESMKHIDNGECAQCTYNEWKDMFESNIHSYIDWKNEVKRTLIEGGNFEDAFYDRGNKNLKIFGVLGTVVAWIILFYFFHSKLFSGMFIFLSLILWLESTVLFLIPERATEKCTPYGWEYYERWMNFKRYIEDFSLIKEYPPESVKIWDKYLVYATALGAAKGVKRTMELLLPETKLKESDMYRYHEYENQKS